MVKALRNVGAVDLVREFIAHGQADITLVVLGLGVERVRVVVLAVRHACVDKI